jgi:hypothetical protein
MRIANRIRGMALLAAVALWTVPAHAQDVPADPAWQLYDQAFERLVAKDTEGAGALLQRLRDQFPGHPAATQATLRLADVAAATPALADQGAETPQTPRRESTSSSARAELALTMTINGVYMGYQACKLLGCQDEYGDSGRGMAASLMIGGGAGLGLSLFLTQGGITQGQAQLLDSSITWGSWNSLLLYDVIEGNRTGAAVGLAFQLGGLGAGLLLDRVWKPTSGEVAVANTAGLWTTVLTAMAFGMADETPDLTTLVIAGDLGLVLGGVLGTHLPGISRGRTLLIDTGGILGMLAGGLIAVAGDANSAREAFVPLFAGTAVGLAIASFATRRWDVPATPPARVSIMPMGREGWGAALSFDLH